MYTYVVVHLFKHTVAAEAFNIMRFRAETIPYLNMISWWKTCLQQSHNYNGNYKV